MNHFLLACSSCHLCSCCVCQPKNHPLIVGFPQTPIHVLVYHTGKVWRCCVCVCLCASACMHLAADPLPSRSSSLWTPPLRQTLCSRWRSWPTTSRYCPAVLLVPGFLASWSLRAPLPSCVQEFSSCDFKEQMVENIVATFQAGPGFDLEFLSIEEPENCVVCDVPLSCTAAAWGWLNTAVSFPYFHLLLFLLLSLPPCTPV